MKKLFLDSLKRYLGVELRRFTPRFSENARLLNLFTKRKIDLVIDVGACTGGYGASVRELGYKGQIVSFEPIPSSYEKLQAISSDDPFWKCAPPMALGDSDGEIEINISNRISSSSIMGMLDSHLAIAPDSKFVDKITVPIYKLDTIVDSYLENNLNEILLKIDVQGFESQVLAGASSTLEKVKIVQLECSLIPLYNGQELLKDLLIKMDSLGFELFDIIPVVVDDSSSKLIQVDAFFEKRTSINNGLEKQK
jgi:FkbM family methyltransferase